MLAPRRLPNLACCIGVHHGNAKAHDQVGQRRAPESSRHQPRHNDSNIGE